MKLALAVLATALAVRAATVRIGVFGLFRPSRLVVKPAPGRVIRIDCGPESAFLEGGHAAGLTLFGAEIDCTIGGTPVSGKTVRVSGRAGEPTEFLLSVPARLERRFAGVLEVTVRQGVLEAVAITDRETVVAAVVAAESPPRAPPAALEAQAIVARSYLVASPRRHEGFDYCDTTHCQFAREPRAAGPAFDAAARTRDSVLLHDGRPITAMYSASCGGHTLTAAEAGLPSAGYPYFAVDCEECRLHADRWTAELTKAQAAPILAAPHSENARLAIARVLGWNRIPGNNYDIRLEGDRVVLDGRGAGHGVGLCQRGAAAMAKAGSDARSILDHYYPGTSARPPPDSR